MDTNAQVKKVAKYNVPSGILAVAVMIIVDKIAPGSFSVEEISVLVAAAVYVINTALVYVKCEYVD